MADPALPLTLGATPRRGGPVVPNGVLGMIIAVACEMMMFAGLVSAQIVVRATARSWPPPGLPLLPARETLFNTAALLLSGLALFFGVRAFRVEPRRARGPIVAALLLGTFFVVFQGYEWVGLLRQGLTITSGSLGGFFYLIVGLHALHAIIAIVALGVLAVRLFQERLALAPLQTVSVFWFFVVGLWPILYWQVYQ